MSNQQLQELNEQMSAMLTEHPPKENLLPIFQVFPDTYYGDGHASRAHLHFDLICKENTLLPSKVLLEIKNAKEVR